MRSRVIGLVAAREVREARRSRWFVLAAASYLVLSLALAWLGLAGADRSGLAGYDRTTASLLNLALLFVPLVTLSLGSLSMAGEIEDGSMAMLLAQPVTRAEVFLGKFIGLLACVSAAVLAGFGATGVLVGVRSGGGNLHAFLGLVGVALLLGATTLAIGSAISVTLASRARVIGAAFTTWLALVYLCDLGTIGLILARALGPAQVFVLALLNPVQQARVLGTLSLSARLEVLGPVGIYALDRFGQAGTVGLLAAVLAATGALALVGGYRVFRQGVVS
jgi:Cu-processing system permease protein